MPTVHKLCGSIHLPRRADQKLGWYRLLLIKLCGIRIVIAMTWNFTNFVKTTCSTKPVYIIQYTEIIVSTRFNFVRYSVRSVLRKPVCFNYMQPYAHDRAHTV
jgi:hypothetical protein